jgi:adenine phosphoribosyltransferase
MRAEGLTGTDLLRAYIRDVADFPSPGILFKDVTPLLQNHAALHTAIQLLTDAVIDFKPTIVMGIESRGFLFGVPVADQLGIGFVPARKPGKLPWQVFREPYGLEYGTDVLELHVDALTSADRVLIVDDVLATGGTAAAACRLVEQAGAAVASVAVLVEISVLDGRTRLRQTTDAPVVAPLTY